MAGGEAGELLAALRYGAGTRPTARQFVQRFAEAIERALSERPEYFTSDEKVAVDAALPELAVALAAGYLKSCLAQQQVSESLASFVARTRLNEVLFTALCARRFEPAADAFARFVDGRFRAMMQRRPSFATQDIDDIVSDLPSHCFATTREWLLAGRPRLVQYSGQSSLAGWLAAVVQSQLTDRLRRQQGRFPQEPADDEAGGGLRDLPDPHASQGDRVTDELRDGQKPVELVRQAFRELLGELQAEHAALVVQGEHSAQYRFVVLRYLEQQSPKQIADHLGIAASRVTELANRVIARLVKHVCQIADSQTLVPRPLTREQRQAVELALQDILGAGENPTGPELEPVALGGR